MGNRLRQVETKQLLDRIGAGRCAESMLSSRWRGAGFVVVCPMWVPEDGGRPGFRFVGDDGWVQIHRFEPCALAGRVAGPGGKRILVDPGQVIPFSCVAEMREVLACLVADGRTAFWEFFNACELVARQATVNAHLSKIAELARTTGRSSTSWLVSDLDCDQIASEVMFDERGPSTFDRMVDACLVDGAFKRVDPVTFCWTRLYKGAAYRLDRFLGDPVDGQRIRAAVADLGTSELEPVRQLVTSRTPGRRVSADGLAAALAVGRVGQPCSLSFEESGDERF
ncbi:hypothetical protein QP568_09960 [Propionimicrobium lymphophilum]|uniref:Uncharacterized protein n=1 Tax=Propionimicrobium lymphophilum ACS-093-V-SCH5 TaxID=883161 RepID=S2W3H4_9ACTN|nr:hypothetical protein [Propionimicrobium lymphophilum]EPD32895.1 hypothetical protein HMPREF9306_01203 [Propionimicrobium lymphophilum ACS-093-V-SCH5]MDK7710818.1 hypothetical protein [Propionimicrobium lymphophilum]MDK7734607.1 hypothetical protein [Propionimicrobium lymphophilum]